MLFVFGVLNYESLFDYYDQNKQSSCAWSAIPTIGIEFLIGVAVIQLSFLKMVDQLWTLPISKFLRNIQWDLMSLLCTGINRVFWRTWLFGRVYVVIPYSASLFKLMVLFRLFDLILKMSWFIKEKEKRSNSRSPNSSLGKNNQKGDMKCLVSSHSGCKRRTFTILTSLF